MKAADASVLLVMFAFAAAIIARLRADQASRLSTNDVAALVATSGHPSGT